MIAYDKLDPVTEILERMKENLSLDNPLKENLSLANPRYDTAMDDAVSVLRIAHHLQSTRGHEGAGMLSTLPIVYIILHCPDSQTGKHWHRCDEEGRVISGAMFTCFTEARMTFKDISSDVVEVTENYKSDDNPHGVMDEVHES